MSNIIKLIFILSLTLTGIIAPTYTVAADDKMGTIKAALIYKLSRFIIWPDSAFAQAHNNIEVCVIGNDTLDVTGKLIKGTHDRKSQGKSLSVIHLTSHTKVKNYQCHIIFYAEEMPATSSSHPKDSIIIVNDKHTLEAKGALGLIIENNKVGVYVNLEHLNDTLIKIDPVVLSFAKRL